MMDLEKALILAVEGMTELLKEKESVGIEARMLPDRCYLIKNLVNISHIEVSAKEKVAGRPVVAAHEGMDIIDSGASGGAVSQMAHVCFPYEREILEGFAPPPRLIYLRAYGSEDCLNGIRSLRAFAEDIFMAGDGVKLHRSDPSGLLTSVMLLLHKEIELVKTIHRSAIFLFIKGKRFEEADHGYSAFMLYQFHK